MARRIKADLAGWAVVGRSDDHLVLRPSAHVLWTMGSTGLILLGISGGLWLFGYRSGWFSIFAHGLCWIGAYILIASPLTGRLAIYRDRQAGVARVWARGPFGWARRIIPLGESRARLIVHQVWRRPPGSRGAGPRLYHGLKWTLTIEGPAPMVLYLTAAVPGESPEDVRILAEPITQLLEARWD